MAKSYRVALGPSRGQMSSNAKPMPGALAPSILGHPASAIERRAHEGRG